MKRLAGWARRCFGKFRAAEPDDGFVRLRLLRLDERRVLTVATVVAGADATVNEGSAYTLPASTFTDSGSSSAPHLAQVNWGDGNTQNLAVTEPGSVGANGTVASATHTYADNGVYTAVVTVFGIDGSSRSDSVQVTVNNVAPTADAGGPYRVAFGGSVQLGGSATDPAGANDPLTYVWDLDADGVFGETGTGAANGNETGATPTFVAGALAQGTSRTVTLRVTDGDGGTDTATATVAVNRLPSITLTSGSLAYTEGDAPTAVDSALIVADADDTTLDGATVQITANYVNGEDVLAFTNQGGITGSWNAASGTLTLSGSGASLSTWRNALRSITFENTGDDPAATKTVSFTLDDGLNTGATVARTIAITAVNDAPTLTATAGSAAFTEGSGGTAIDPTLTVTDPDDTQLNGATIQITTNYDNGDDLLEFTTQNGITGSFVAGTGTLTLTGTASKANYQAALRSVTFRNTSDTPTTGVRTVTFRVSDGTANSNTALRTVTVTPTNDAPTVTTSSGSTNYTENAAAVVIDAGLTVADVDDADLEGATVQITGAVAGQEFLDFTNQNGISGSYNSATGTLTLSGTATKAEYRTALRSVAYRSTDDNPAATRTITFRVNDGDVDGAAASKTIAITAVNDAPTLTATAGSATFTEGGLGAIVDPGITIADPDDVQIDGATIQITTNYVSGQDLLQFTNQNGISGGFVSGTGTLTLTGTATLAQYQTALQSIRFHNNSDAPSTAARTVTFRVSDGTANSNVVSRNVGITTVNDAPTVTTTSGTTSFVEDGAAVAVDANLTVADVDDANLEGAEVRITNFVFGEDVLQFTNQNGITGFYNPLSGTLSLSGTATKAQYQTALRSVKYDNPSDAPTTTVRVITFRVNDGDVDGATASRNVSVTPSNDAPTVTTSAGSASYTENAPGAAVDPGLTVADVDSVNLASATIQITGNYAAGQDVLQFTNQTGISGSWNATTGTLTLTGTAPKADYQTALRSVTYVNTSENPSTAVRTVSFRADDGAANGAAATRTVTVTAVNDAPTIVPPVDLLAPGTLTIGPLSVQVADVDTPLGTLVLTATSNAQAIIPDAGITVAGVGAVRTVTLLPVANASGLVVITLTLDDQAGGVVQRTFQISVDNLPTISTPATVRLNEDAPQQGVTVTVGDVETPAGNLVVTVQSSNTALVAPGTLIVTSDGAAQRTIAFTPTADRSGTTTLTLTVTDSVGHTATTTFQVVVDPVNDAPIADAQSRSVREDVDLTGVLTGSDGDADFVQTLTFSISTGPAHGTITAFNPTTGAYTYRPANNFSGVDTFRFRVTDDAGAGANGPLTSTEQTVTVTVTPVADAPVFGTAAPQITAPEATIVPVGIVVQLADVDGSESISAVRISDVPVLVSFVDAAGVEYPHTIAAGTKSYVLTLAQFAAARVVAPDDVHATLAIRAVSTEAGAPVNSPDRQAETLVLVPIDVVNTPPVIQSLTGTDVDADATTTLGAVVTDSPADFFSVVIRWGQSTIGLVQQTSLPGLGPQIANIVQSFQFLIAPDPQNPSAPILITVTATDDDGGVAKESITVQVSGTGIPTTFIHDFGFVAPAPVVTPFVIPRQVDTRVYAAPVQATSDFGAVMPERTVAGTRAVLLRIVSARGVESPNAFRLSAVVLNDLPAFLRKLPDGHYRLYLSENEFTPDRMLVDVVMFRGRAVAPGDVQAHRPPTAATPTASTPASGAGGDDTNDAAPRERTSSALPAGSPAPIDADVPAAGGSAVAGRPQAGERGR